MSFIHAHRHEAPGLIAGIVDLYLPLEEINDPQEFVANPGDILLGGGSGELPAWVIDPNVAVERIAEYLFFGKGFITDYNPEARRVLQEAGVDVDNQDIYVDFMDSLVPLHKEVVDWPTWGGDEWFAIVTEAQGKGYDRDKHSNIESWLLEEVGAWVLKTRPDLITAKLSEQDEQFLAAARKLLDAQPGRGSVEPY